jgi:chemotaxis protein methyltransferase CheR
MPHSAPAWNDHVPELSDRDLKAIAELVYEKSGITLHSGKRALIIARLQKRVKHGGFANFAQYLRHVEADRTGDELTALLDAIATNHTSFFREGQHFDFLRDVVLPPLMARSDGGRIQGWSAACSTGEEPYTIAMVCSERLGAQASRLKLLASDLSTKVLKTAKAGVYRADRVNGLSLETLKRHFEKGLGSHEGTVRVRAALRQLVEFRQINLLEPITPGQMFDFVFCRNVMIYFDTRVQQRVVTALERRLLPGGYLFISHSESLNGVQHGLRWVAPAIYRRESAR